MAFLPPASDTVLYGRSTNKLSANLSLEITGHEVGEKIATYGVIIVSLNSVNPKAAVS